MTELLQTLITGRVAFTIHCQSASETTECQETVSELRSSSLLFAHPPYISFHKKEPETIPFTRDNVTSLPGPIPWPLSLIAKAEVLETRLKTEAPLSEQTDFSVNDPRSASAT